MAREFKQRGNLSTPQTIPAFRYLKGRSGVCSSNIIFPRKWPMRGGKFPAGHPCSDDPKPTVMGKWTRIDPATKERAECPGEQPESDTALGKFRARGYWASCFPEGDGITFEPLKGQDDDTIRRDIAECFSVTVRQP